MLLTYFPCEELLLKYYIMGLRFIGVATLWMILLRIKPGSLKRIDLLSKVFYVTNHYYSILPLTQWGSYLVQTNISLLAL